MKLSQEYYDNLQRVRDCTNFKHVDRIIHLSNFYTWKILDSDRHVKLSEAMTSYETLELIQREFQEKYHFDIHMDLNTRNLILPSQAMGSGNHIMIDDANESINFYDHVLMEQDEYPEYKSKRAEMNWKMFNRKYPGLDKRHFLDAFIKQQEASAFAGYMGRMMVEDYGCLGVYDTDVAGGAVQVPFERFPKYYRGIKEIAFDMRRKKADMLDCLDYIQQNEIIPGLKKTLAEMEGKDSLYMADFMIAMLAHGTISQKQWDTFYWPYLKEYLDMIVAAGKTVVFYLENSIMRFAEYFQDYPKGHIIMILELDDLVELRKKLPNICFAGGMPASLLGNGTPEECVDRVKYLVNELGDGFILSQDKMMAFRNDCRRENLEAVCEYVNNFRW